MVLVVQDWDRVERGIGMSVTSWMSSEGFRIDEVGVLYSSIEDACRDFEFEAQHAEQTSAQTPARSTKRIVGKYGSTFKVITLEGKRLHYVQGPTLETVLNFEASWLRFEWL